MSRSSLCDTGDAGWSFGCSVTIITRDSFNCVHEMGSISLVVRLQKNGLHSFPGDQEQQALSRRAVSASALTQSVITLPFDKLSLYSFHAKLRHELGRLMGKCSIFFTDPYGGLNEETSVENRLKKYWVVTNLRHILWHALTCVIMTCHNFDCSFLHFVAVALWASFTWAASNDLSIGTLI